MIFLIPCCLARIVEVIGFKLRMTTVEMLWQKQIGKSRDGQTATERWLYLTTKKNPKFSYIE